MKKRYVSILLLSSFIFLSMFPTDINKARAGLGPPLILPNASFPASMVYDNVTNSVWVALQGNVGGFNGSIANIDVATKTVTGIYELPYSLDAGTWGAFAHYITIDSDGNIWVAPSGYISYPHNYGNNTFAPPEVYVFEFNVTSQNFTTVLVDGNSDFAGTSAIEYSNGYIWVLGRANIYRVDYSNNNEVLTITLPVGAMDGSLKADGTSLWISTRWTYTILKLNTTDCTIETAFYPLWYPFGMCVDKDFLYIAEQGPITGGIAYGNSTVIMNKTDYTVTRMTTEGSGIQSVVQDENGYLWWADTAQGGDNIYMHIGVKDFKYGLVDNVYTLHQFAYHLVYVPDSGVWASYVGSAGILVFSLPKIETDINKDGIINMRDIGLVAYHFGTNENDTSWSPACDITGQYGEPDGKVDMRDIGAVARHFGETAE